MVFRRDPSLRRNIVLFVLAICAQGIAIQVHFAIFNNFAVEKIGLAPEELGILESIREIPGFLAAPMVGLLVGLAEPRVAAFSLMIFGAGYFAYGYTETVPTLIAFSFLWSIGFHVWMPTAASMALGLAAPGAQGRVLGRMQSLAAFSGVIGILCVFWTADTFSFSGIYQMIGLAAILGAIPLFFMDTNLGHRSPVRLVLKRKYALFYGLEFLAGCRRQIFVTFALFALVKTFGVDVTTIITLSLINSCANICMAPFVGKLIDRFGERSVLTVNFAALTLIFVGYGAVKNVNVLFVLYVVDNLFMLFTLSLSTYIGRIAAPEELRASLSMGITMNHVAAVLMPLVGGFLWSYLGYSAVFYLGAGIAAATLVLARRLPRRAPVPA